MKYPIATVAKLIDTFGSDIAIGYDVGYALSKILVNSSLGTRVKELGLRCVVGGFHGYAHNLLCQLNWHPLFVDGTGEEDFEGCERGFSESNALAAATRLATAFHRAQAIEQHWSFWNEDKHANTGGFQFTNMFLL